jgi:hypothetical protein
LRSHDGLAVDDAHSGVVTLGLQRTRPLLHLNGDVRLQPFEPHLVAVEETAKLCAGGVPPMAEDDRPSRGRRRRASLQALGPA